MSLSSGPVLLIICKRFTRRFIQYYDYCTTPNPIEPRMDDPRDLKIWCTPMAIPPESGARLKSRDLPWVLIFFYIFSIKRKGKRRKRKEIQYFVFLHSILTTRNKVRKKEEREGRKREIVGREKTGKGRESLFLCLSTNSSPLHLSIDIFLAILW